MLSPREKSDQKNKTFLFSPAIINQKSSPRSMTNNTESIMRRVPSHLITQYKKLQERQQKGIGTADQSILKHNPDDKAFLAQESSSQNTFAQVAKARNLSDNELSALGEAQVAG